MQIVFFKTLNDILRGWSIMSCLPLGRHAKRQMVDALNGSE